MNAKNLAKLTVQREQVRQMPSKDGIADGGRAGQQMSAQI
jgi:hypothetical protein